MSTHSYRTGSEGPPTVREIADLTARLRILTAPGHTPGLGERTAFLADKTALLARIIPAVDEDGPR